jgi:hypothetical protein
LLRKLVTMSLNVSAFTQLQNWFAGQANLNKQIFGDPNAAPTTDFSTAFANAETNFSSQQSVLATTAMQLRQVQQAQATQKPASNTTAKTHASGSASSASSSTSTAKTAAGKSTADRLTIAKAAGNDILTALGLIAPPPQKTAPSSSSGPYKPPINPATGHAYVATSATGLGNLGALNIFA